ncbi:MAG: hypothetical protein K2K06_04765 [Oscillospiraceae bacterium]|nr:hypothetical protein [Oscillospiraceae bacterium]
MKKRILIFTLTALLVSASSALSANAITLGDVNGDSNIDALDATDILIHSASVGAGNGGTLLGEALTSSDVNGDGIVDAVDATEILIYSAEIGAGNKYIFPAENQVTDDEWKQAYQIQLDNLQTDEEYYYYDLVDINNDSVPELFVILSEGQQNVLTIYSYQNGICQPFTFQTKSGAVSTSLNTSTRDYKYPSAYYAIEENALLVQNVEYDWDIYQINNINASLEHQLSCDFTTDEGAYYYDGNPITENQYNEYLEVYFNNYWISFCSATDSILLNSYSTTGELQASFDSVYYSIAYGTLDFAITCNNITEKSNATVNIVPHGTSHTIEAIANSEWTDYSSSLYESAHYNYNYLYMPSDITAGEYDLFILADDFVTELDSVTFTVAEKDTRYKNVYKNKLASISDSDYMYSLYDLNSDGIPELFISTGDYHAAGIKLYTCSDGYLKEVTGEYGLGSYGTVNVSNNILLSWYYGMDYESSFFYYMADDNTLELQDYFSIDHNTTPATYYYYESDITEAEYNALHAPYDNLYYVELGRDYKISNTSPIDNY